MQDYKQAHCECKTGRTAVSRFKEIRPCLCFIRLDEKSKQAYLVMYPPCHALCIVPTTCLDYSAFDGTALADSITGGKYLDDKYGAIYSKSEHVMPNLQYNTMVNGNLMCTLIT